MITATEKGRRLHLLIGSDDDGELFIIEPVDVEGGAALLANFLTLYVGVVSDLETTAEDMALLSLGTAENVERAKKLRSAEFNDLVQTAFFWNVQGGGTQAMNTYLQDGHPKAVEVVFAAAGVQTKQRSLTLPSSESENPTP